MFKGETLIKFSIIMPVYNVKDYLYDSINSVIENGYENYELILVDDGSTDSSGKICDVYKSDKVKVFHNKNNGLGYARNFGLSKVTGDYIYFLDSDDTLEKNVFNEAVKLIDDDKYDVILSNKVKIIDCIDNKITCDDLVEINNDKNSKINKSNFVLHHGCIGNAIYSKEYLKKLNILFSTKRDFCEDDTWLFQILNNTNNCKVLDYPLYLYKKNRSGSIVNTINENNLVATLEETEKSIDFVSKSNYLYKDKLNTKYANRLFNYLLNYNQIKNNEIKEKLVYFFDKYFSFLHHSNMKIGKLLNLRFFMSKKRLLGLLSKIALRGN